MKKYKSTKNNLFILYVLINGVQQYFLFERHLPEISFLITIILTIFFVFLYRKKH